MNAIKGNLFGMVELKPAIPDRLSVNSRREEENMLTIEKILFPTDFSEPFCEALRAVNELASHFSSEITLIRVVSTTPFIPASPGLTDILLTKLDVQQLGVFDSKTRQVHHHREANDVGTIR
ncbi:MAG: hypothetical protein ABIK28_13275 [Planctomycetota bacterium]